MDFLGFEIKRNKSKQNTRSTPNENLNTAPEYNQGWDAWLGNATGHVGPETSLKLSAIWSAVRILSEIPASLPKNVMTKIGNSWTIDNNNPVSELLEYPNQHMTGFDFHEMMNSSLQLRGNSLAIIKTDRRGYPVELLPVDWSSVRPYFQNNQVVYDVNDILFGVKGVFAASDVLHYKLFSKNGLIGRSPIAMARENISLALSAESFGKEFFDRGGNHKAVIETENPFKSYAEYAKWREKYEEEHTGRGKNHDVPVLQPGMKFKQLTMSMEDMQFVATRQFALNDVSRWFNIPPHLIGDLSKATFSNIEHQDLQFIKYTLRGVVKRQEKEWEMKLFSPAVRRTSGVKFNLDGLARGDMQTRSTYIVNMVNAGVMTPNEGRQIENLQPIAGNDELRIPANIVGNIQSPQNGK